MDNDAQQLDTLDDDMVDLNSEVFQTPQSPQSAVVTKSPCPLCDSPTCPGTENVLREYSSWDDLTAHCGEAEIVGWVNQLARLLRQKRELARRVNTRKREQERALRAFAKEAGLLP